MPAKKIPKFSSEDEEREFWDTHDFNDYIDWDSGQHLDLSYLRPAPLGGNLFADFVLILTDALPGWVLLDFQDRDVVVTKSAVTSESPGRG